MTAIIGYADGKNVWMAGDSATTTGSWSRHIMLGEKKIFRLKDMLFGASGLSRVGQALQYSLELPARIEGMTDHQYLVKLVIPAVTKCLKETEASMNSDDVKSVILIGYNGVLYRLSYVMDVMAYQNQIMAIGVGDDLAKGAFRALIGEGVDIPTALIRSLEITHEFNLAVAPPFYIESLHDDAGDQ